MSNCPKCGLMVPSLGCSNCPPFQTNCVRCGTPVWIASDPESIEVANDIIKRRINRE